MHHVDYMYACQKKIDTVLTVLRDLNNLQLNSNIGNKILPF